MTLPRLLMLTHHSHAGHVTNLTAGKYDTNVPLDGPNEPHLMIFEDGEWLFGNDEDVEFHQNNTATFLQAITLPGVMIALDKYIVEKGIA